jgi:predicted ArsR family transcriptional regulator
MTSPPVRPRDSTTYRALAGESRQALLAALQLSGRPLDASEAGAAVGLHRNTARVHLDVLCSVGLLKRRIEHRTTRGRPRVVYELAVADAGLLDGNPAGEDEVGYRELARLLAQQLAELADVSGEAIRAGRRWAAALDGRPLPAQRLSAGEAISVVTDVLDRLGFDPQPEEDLGRILLHHCPFAEIARENRSVVCGIHLGMLKATVERLDAPLDVVGLEPLVTDEPSLCIVRLATRVASPKRRRQSEETP